MLHTLDFHYYILVRRADGAGATIDCNADRLVGRLAGATFDSARTTKFAADQNATLRIIRPIARMYLNLIALRHARQLNSPFIRMVVNKNSIVGPGWDGTDQRSVSLPG